MLFAWASSPSVRASCWICSEAASNWSFEYSTMLVDFTKSLLDRGLKNFALIPVGSVWLGPAQ